MVSVRRPENESFFLNQPGPLDFEIGCGVGFHPLTRARRWPERRLVAIEHTQNRFAKFFKNYQQAGSPPNLLPVNANAIGWLSQLELQDEFENVFLLYPNPNPLNSSQRWFLMPFFQRLLLAIKLGGSLTLATNERWYYEEALVQSKKIWKLKILEAGLWTGEPRTHFEKKYLERGEPCYHLKVQKVRGTFNGLIQKV